MCLWNTCPPMRFAMLTVMSFFNLSLNSYRNAVCDVPPQNKTFQGRQDLHTLWVRSTVSRSPF